MISVVKKKNEIYSVDFVWEKDAHIRSFKMGLEKVFRGEYLESLLVPLSSQAVLLAGCGKEEELGLLQVKEILAAVSKRCKELHIRNFPGSRMLCGKTGRKGNYGRGIRAGTWRLFL